MISRRNVLKASGLLAGATVGVGGYAVAEPRHLVVRHYRLMPPHWPAGLTVRFALIADLHVCSPWMTAARVAAIVERTNELAPDCTLLLGDYMPGGRLLRFARPVAASDWAAELAALKAPLGVFAVLGNHDWWDDADAQRRGKGPTVAGQALEAAGIPVLENRAVRRIKNGQPFWIAGLGDQIAIVRRNARGKVYFQGKDDLQGTLAQVSDSAPVVVMAHEPDIFPEMPDRVSLTVSGHTHGGQVNLPGSARFIPSRYGDRYRYGHIIEDGRNLIVSGGLGCSAVPVRFGVPPEIVIVELGGAPAATTS